MSRDGTKLLPGYQLWYKMVEGLAPALAVAGQSAQPSQPIERTRCKCHLDHNAIRSSVRLIVRLVFYVSSFLIFHILWHEAHSLNSLHAIVYR